MNNGVDEQHAVSYGSRPRPRFHVALELMAVSIEIPVLPALVPVALTHLPLITRTSHRLVLRLGRQSHLELQFTPWAANTAVGNADDIGEALPQPPTDVVDYLVVEEAAGTGLVEADELVRGDHRRPANALIS